MRFILIFCSFSVGVTALMSSCGTSTFRAQKAAAISASEDSSATASDVSVNTTGTIPNIVLGTTETNTQIDTPTDTETSVLVVVADTATGVEVSGNEVETETSSHKDPRVFVITKTVKQGFAISMNLSDAVQTYNDATITSFTCKDCAGLASLNNSTFRFEAKAQLEAKKYDFAVQVTDSMGGQATLPISITVESVVIPVPSVTPSTPTPAPRAACGSVPDGGSVKRYQSTSVNYPNKCVSQTRTCSDGDLSGSYSQTSCREYGQKQTFATAPEGVPTVSLYQQVSSIVSGRILSGTPTNRAAFHANVNSIVYHPYVLTKDPSTSALANANVNGSVQQYVTSSDWGFRRVALWVFWFRNNDTWLNADTEVLYTRFRCPDGTSKDVAVGSASELASRQASIGGVNHYSSTGPSNGNGFAAADSYNNTVKQKNSSYVCKTYN